MELPLAEKAAKEHVAVTRKTAVEQTRPVSRHKPPVQSLFLEVPETRRQIPSTFSTALAGTESCGGPTPGRYSIDSTDMKASTICSSAQCLQLYSLVDANHEYSTRMRCSYRAPTANTYCVWTPPEAPRSTRGAALQDLEVSPTIWNVQAVVWKSGLFRAATVSDRCACATHYVACVASL